MTFDIRNHRWSDVNPFGINVPILRGVINLVFNRPVLNFKLNKNDSTAIAKHFHDLMTDDEKIDFWDTMYEGYERHYGDAPQSETPKGLNDND